MNLVYAILMVMAFMFPVAGFALYVNLKESREKAEKKSQATTHQA